MGKGSDIDSDSDIDKDIYSCA